MKYRIIILLAIAILIYGCSESKHDERLLRISEIVSASPAEALSGLDSICCDSLSEADRHYYDFLTVKATDKAFVVHKSDSLILSVINYYSQHPDGALYPEALYYGGRVYSDLGDKPKALTYFHSALDLLPPETDNKSLRSKVLAQATDISISLRLYKKALAFIKDAITIDIEINDSISLLDDMDQLGTIYLNTREYDLAEKAFRSARALALSVDTSVVATHDMNLAAVKYHKGDIDSAMCLIRPALKNIDKYYRHSAVAVACQIYRKANIPDTTLMLAHELINDTGFPNRRIGYNTILSPEMRRHVAPDSAVNYAYESSNEVEAYLNKNGDREALIQNTVYNYETYVKELEKSEEVNERLYTIIIILLIIVAAFAIYTLWRKYKKQSNRLDIYKSKSNIRALRLDFLESGNRKDTITEDNTGENAGSESCKANGTVCDMAVSQSDNLSESDRLQVSLREDIMALLHDNEEPAAIANEVLESEVYRNMMQYLGAGKAVSDSNHIWDDLEKVVAAAYPHFIRRLHLLSDGMLEPAYFRLAMLMKCGFSQANVAVLVGRTKSAITYRRQKLGKILFNQNIDLDTLERIIRLL